MINIKDKSLFILGSLILCGIGAIVDEQGTYDDEGDELTSPTYINGYHVDMMVDREINFDSEFFPSNEIHKFA